MALVFLLLFWRIQSVFTQRVSHGLSVQNFYQLIWPEVLASVVLIVTTATVRHRVRRRNEDQIEFYWRVLWFKVGGRIYQRDKLQLVKTQNLSRYFCIDLIAGEEAILSVVVPTEGEADVYFDSFEIHR